MKALTYYQRNKAKVLRKTRQTRLTSKGGKVYLHLKKRPRPDTCELHQSVVGISVRFVHLEYHHWDNNRPSVGMWLCCSCHRYVEAYENPRFSHNIEAYRKLKDSIEASSHEIEPLHSLRWKGK